MLPDCAACPRVIIVPPMSAVVVISAPRPPTFSAVIFDKTLAVVIVPLEPYSRPLPSINVAEEPSVMVCPFRSRSLSKIRLSLTEASAFKVKVSSTIKF